MTTQEPTALSPVPLDLNKQLIVYNYTDETLIKLRETAKEVHLVALDDKESLAKVRETRLQLRAVRCAIEARRKELKKGALEFGNRVDAEADRLTGFIEPQENRLADEEASVEREKARLQKEEERKAYEQRAARIKEIQLATMPGTVPDLMMIAALPQDQYDSVISAMQKAKLAHEEEQRQRADEARREREQREADDRARAAQQKAIDDARAAEAQQLRERQAALELRAREADAREQRERLFVLAYRGEHGRGLLRSALDHDRRDAPGHEPDGRGETVADATERGLGEFGRARGARDGGHADGGEQEVADAERAEHERGREPGDVLRARGEVEGEGLQRERRESAAGGGGADVGEPVGCGRQRRAEEPRRESEGRGAVGRSGTEVGEPARARLEERLDRLRVSGFPAAWPPSPADADGWQRATEADPWIAPALESPFRRVAPRVPDGLDEPYVNPVRWGHGKTCDQGEAEAVRLVRPDDEAQEDRNQAGGHGSVPQAEALQCDLLGDGAQEGGSKPGRLPEARSAQSQRVVRDLWGAQRAGDSPQGPQLGKQRPVELADALRFLSHIAAPRGWGHQPEAHPAAVRGLREAILQTRPLLDPPIALQEAWGSASDATQHGWVVDACARIVTAFRADRLRCLGNAVVPACARAAFAELAGRVLA